MYYRGSFWARLIAWLNLSPSFEPPADQVPLGGKTDFIQTIPSHTNIAPLPFKPPSGSNGDDFVCEYPAMKKYVPCSDPNNRECWLRNVEDGSEYNIHTNYEVEAPTGITRNYTLVVGDGWYNGDGQYLKAAKLFNDTYPGPWLQACWGDTVNVTVINNMTWNGTSIHWHGIRQHKTMHMDGVNGITQCPIAPKSRLDSSWPNVEGDRFTYIWKAVQYGTSWYHSHYSVQYADGLQGALTIHGPHSGNYDEAKIPLIMTDWTHISSFESMASPTPAETNTTILLNGRGDVRKFGYEVTPGLELPALWEIHFQAKEISRPGRSKRYLLRLINTSFDSTFVFSIDNHWLQIISSDFVPIEPYFNTSVLVGIGQRYNVIVEADPSAGQTNPIPSDGNFWIRTWIPKNCGTKPGRQGYERTGILRYNHLSDTAPTSQPWNGISLRCSDETYTSLKPKLPWYINRPKGSHNDGAGADPEIFGVQLNKDLKPDNFPLARFSFEPNANDGFTPLQINYSDPSFLHLSDYSGDWPKSWVMTPENGHDLDWIHLHGHDFAVLEQAENKTYNVSNLNLKWDNPPRRDVVLLPRDGYVVIAFKTDNPGMWLLHCHIARHASFGLGIQINERQEDADKIWPFHTDDAIAAANKTCDNWRAWQSQCKNLWPGPLNTSGNTTWKACEENHEKNPKVWPFQDDSGI
ncbi:Lcc2 [Colletotrichum truncatum]|uniref:Lcc2 n=1 Tax=Colletotrichum truncatum TaxID=5467 RepID=A0ACC3ZLM5_COLTU